MKARPRSVENRVAGEFSKIFTRYGLEPVARIPVLGRTGPDVSINKAGFVIDVKSRKKVPKTYLYVPWKKCGIAQAGQFLLCPIKHFDEFVIRGKREVGPPLDFQSGPVREWWLHMDEWTRRNRPGDFSMIVLHKPRIPIGNAVVVFHEKDRRSIQCRMQNLSTLKINPN